ncbi:hypothetical protein U1Q18_010288 [Sarracenia purpurea var. burkii]
MYRTKSEREIERKDERRLERRRTRFPGSRNCKRQQLRVPTSEGARLRTRWALKNRLNIRVAEAISEVVFAERRNRTGAEGFLAKKKGKQWFAVEATCSFDHREIWREDFPVRGLHLRRRCSRKEASLGSFWSGTAKKKTNNQWNTDWFGTQLFWEIFWCGAREEKERPSGYLGKNWNCLRGKSFFQLEVLCLNPVSQKRNHGLGNWL